MNKFKSFLDFLHKLIKTICFIFIGYIFFVSIFLIMYIPISKVLNPNSLIFQIILVLSYFTFGFFISFFNKKHPLKLCIYFSIIMLFFNVIVTGFIYHFFLLKLETFQLIIKNLPSDFNMWYDELIILCSVFFIPLGGYIKVLLFNRRKK